MIRTDHKALVNAINNGSGDHSLHEQRMINYVKEYGPQMEHICGDKNAVADSLSRPNEPLVNFIENNNWEIPSIENFALHQEEDPQMQKELDALKSSKKFSLESRKIGNLLLHGVRDEENTKFRPIVPSLLQPAIFHTFHDTLHQGGDKSLDSIKRHYYWSTMSVDIKRWVKFCPKCQTCKITKHNRQVLGNFPNNPKRLQVVHLDIVGPINPESEEHRFLLTMRDRNTGFVQLVPLVNKTSSAVTNAFKACWIAIFGVPDKIITDNGREFVAGEFDSICDTLGILHIKTTPYHPQANGFIERVHRILKTALRALDDKEQWVFQVPLITLMLNNQITDKNLHTPYQKTFDKTCRVPGVILADENLDINLGDKEVQIFCELMSHHHRQARLLDNSRCQMDDNLFQSKYVWVRKEGFKPSLAPIYEGPYVVTQRNKKYFLISGWEGEQKVSVDRLKTAYLSKEYLLPEEWEDPVPEDFQSQYTEVSNSPVGLRKSKRVRKKPDRLKL